MTAAGAAAIERAVEGIELDDLQATYGCPDCADGGAAHVVLKAGDITKRITYDYDGPPPELATVHPLMLEVVAALAECRPSELV